MVRNAETPAVETPVARERNAAVSAAAFGAFLVNPDNAKLTVAEAAVKLGMSVGSFRTRYSAFRKGFEAAGKPLAGFVDGRHGRKGVKRVEKNATQRAIEALIAANK